MTHGTIHGMTFSAETVSRYFGEMVTLREKIRNEFGIGCLGYPRITGKV